MPEPEPDLEETAREESLREELAGVDANLLTPMQALSLIAEWKEKYR